MPFTNGDPALERSAASVARRQKSRYSAFMTKSRDFALSRVSPTAILGGLLLRPARR